jgi:hypothetical protein
LAGVVAAPLVVRELSRAPLVDAGGGATVELDGRPDVDEARFAKDVARGPTGAANVDSTNAWIARRTHATRAGCARSVFFLADVPRARGALSDLVLAVVGNNATLSGGVRDVDDTRVLHGTTPRHPSTTTDHGAQAPSRFTAVVAPSGTWILVVTAHGNVDACLDGDDSARFLASLRRP